MRSCPPGNKKEVYLRLLKPVEGKLPEKVVKAQAAHCKAQAAREKAWAAYKKTWAPFFKARVARDGAGAALGKAWVAYKETWVPYNKSQAALEKAFEDHKEEIGALHAKECPDCPWDGNTIFPETA